MIAIARSLFSPLPCPALQNSSIVVGSVLLVASVAGYVMKTMSLTTSALLASYSITFFIYGFTTVLGPLALATISILGILLASLSFWQECRQCQVIQQPYQNSLINSKGNPTAQTPLTSYNPLSQSQPTITPAVQPFKPNLNPLPLPQPILPSLNPIPLPQPITSAVQPLPQSILPNLHPLPIPQLITPVVHQLPQPTIPNLNSLPLPQATMTPVVQPLPQPTIPKFNPPIRVRDPYSPQGSRWK